MKKNRKGKRSEIVDGGMLAKHHAQIGLIIGILVLLSASIGVVSATTIIVQPGESIQEAINNLPTEGGIVELGEGVHDVYDTIIINRNDVTIQGTHNSEIRSHDSSKDIFVFHHENPVPEEDWANMPILKNFLFKGFKVSSSYEYIYNNHNSGISAWNVENITVEDILDESWVRLFVSVNPTGGGTSAVSRDIFIKDNTVYNSECPIVCWSENIHVLNNRLEGSRAIIHIDRSNKHIHVIGNYVDSSGGTYAGIVMDISRDYEVRDNVVIGNRYGIRITAGPDDVVVSNNIVRGTRDAGIQFDELYGMENVVVSNNIIYNNQGAGILSTHHYWVPEDDIPQGFAKVINNVIHNNGGDGIEMTSSTVTLDISNNIITNNGGYGINYIATREPSSINYNNNFGNPLGNSNIQIAGTGNIEVKPLFANSADGDFHITSTSGRFDGSAWVADSENSPCIDGGCFLVDYSNEPSPNGGRINLGAYGNTPEASMSPGGDTTPPTVITHLPTGTNVPINTDVTVTFSEAMHQTSAQNAFSISPSVAGLFTWNGNIMAFSPNSNLANETTYTITINTTAEDLAGNKLQSSYSWDFTTISSGECYTYKLVNPGESIQDAINGLCQEGGTIELAPGIHEIDDAMYPPGIRVYERGDWDIHYSILVDKSNITIQGTEESIIRHHNPTVYCFFTPDLDTEERFENITYKGFKVSDAYGGIRGKHIISAMHVKDFTVENIHSDVYVYNFANVWNWQGGEPRYSENVFYTNNVLLKGGLTVLFAKNVHWIDNTLYAGHIDINRITEYAYVHGNYVSGQPNFCLRGHDGNHIYVYNNVFEGSDAGIYSDGLSDIECYNNTIKGSSIAGIYINPQNLVTNQVFRNNRIYNCALGVKTEHYSFGFSGKVSDADIVNNVIYNCAGDGIQMTSEYVQLNIRNNIITNNGGYGINYMDTIEPTTVKCNDVWQNANGNYHVISSGADDISKDPLFADPANGDFHMKSTDGRWNGLAWVIDGLTSPCIDTGDPTSDYSNEPSPNGGRINMGAYGNTDEASKSPTPIEEGVIIWDTNHIYDDKFYDFAAYADKDDWTQVPYETTEEYTFNGDAVIENDQFFLFLHSNPNDCVFLYPKRSSGYGSVNEIYKVYDSGLRYFGHGTNYTKILKNTLEVVIVEHAGVSTKGGSPINVVTTYHISREPWIEIKPVDRVNQQGMHDKSRLAAFVFQSAGDDIILDADKHGDFIETVNPPAGCIGEINFNRGSVEFMWFLTFPPGTESNSLTYQTMDHPDCYWERDCRCCVPRSVGQNFAYLGEKVVIGVLNFDNNWKREDVNQPISTGETYTSSFTAPYAGKWRVAAVFSDDDHYITDNIREVVANAGDHFTFTSTRNGTLDYLVMYMVDRTDATAEDITTIMDVYRETISGGAPPAPDTTAPAAVADLAASDPTTHSIELTWTAPGDDGNTGTASQYEIRYSTTEISEANWNSATQCTGEPTPKVAGSNETFTVTGLAPNTTYYVALKTADEVPNWAGISNCTNGTTSEITYQYVWIEAENANLLTPDFEIANDTSASNGKYIQIPEGVGWCTDDGEATYRITIDSPGNYVVWGTKIAATGGDNSFFVQIDDGTRYLWTLALSNNWQWDAVNHWGSGGEFDPEIDPVVFTLSAGEHTLRIIQRENGAKLDRLLITNNMSYVPPDIEDTTPPASISNLQNSTGTTWINWTWTNPLDTDFSHTKVYLDGISQPNMSNMYFNATNLTPDTSYGIGTRTVDTTGNVNSTWVNQTAKTLASNNPPIADPNNPYTGTEGVPIHFTGNGSYDPDGFIVAYLWTYGDGNNATGVTPTHTYAQNGTYNVTLTVTDNEGATNTSKTTANIESDLIPPYTTGHSPAKDAIEVAKNTTIVVHVRDDGAGVDITSIVMTVNGIIVTPIITGTPADYTLTYVPSTDFECGQIVYVTVDAHDLATARDGKK